MDATEIQGLLRFLSQDAKIPLQVAITKIRPLQSANLATPQAIASNSITVLGPIFPDPKHQRAILSAAKRVSSSNTNKRPSTSSNSTTTSPSKRTKLNSPSSYSTSWPNQTPDESALALPTSSLPPTELSTITLQTNRAPLFLAFAVTCLRHTMPRQPASSRLSLAQAVVSANSNSKAVSLGLRGADEENRALGEMKGLRTVKVMGRDVGVLRRVVVPPVVGGEGGEASAAAAQAPADDDEPFLWGVDLDALRKSMHTTTSTLPVHTPQSAHAYLHKSFASVPDPSAPTPSKQPSAKVLIAQRAENLGHLLRALELLFDSWMRAVPEKGFYGLGKEKLQRMAWGWYVKTRPDVRDGVKGWGEKGVVRLGDILALRREGGGGEGEGEKSVEGDGDGQDLGEEGVSQESGTTIVGD